MKHLIINLLSIILSSQLIGLTKANAGTTPLTQTDLTKVFNTGKTNNVNAPKINLHPGVYIIGDENHKLFGTHYLIIDKSANDDSKVLAIMMRKHDLNDETKGVGKFYIGKSIKGGTSMMLSPVFIDIYGNLAIESELNQKAPVIEISLRNNADDFRYPYILQGHNGALNSQLLGMRAVNDEKIALNPWPSNSIFTGENHHENIVISGSTVSVHNSRTVQQRYELLPINGEMGKFSELVSTELDTMGETMVSDSEVKKLGFFFKRQSYDENQSGREIFIIATPAINVGEYTFEFFGPKCRTFTDYFFAGGI